MKRRERKIEERETKEEVIKMKKEDDDEAFQGHFFLFFC